MITLPGIASIPTFTEYTEARDILYESLKKLAARTVGDDLNGLPPEIVTVTPEGKPAILVEKLKVEVPVGVMNGLNRVFTLSQLPMGDRILVFVGPHDLVGGVDFGRDHKTLTLAAVPQARVLVAYSYKAPLGVEIPSIEGLPPPGNPGTAATWVAETPPNPINLSSIAWSPELSLFACASPTSNAPIITSPTGATWTECTPYGSADPYSMRGVCWGNNRFLIVNGVTRYSHTSYDGVAWTRNAFRADGDYYGPDHLYAATWAEDLGLFFAVGGNTAPRSFIQASQNGWDWMDRNMPTPISELLCVCWSPELHLLVAAGSADLMTSSDGVAWTAQASPGVVEGIAWSPELGLFVACGDSGASGVPPGATGIYTSPDGVTWTAQTVPYTVGGRVFRAVAWSRSRQLFVAVSGNAAETSATEPAVITSPNGVTWTPHLDLSGELTEWHGIACADTIDKIVAVGPIVGGGTYSIMRSSV